MLFRTTKLDVFRTPPLIFTPSSLIRNLEIFQPRRLFWSHRLLGTWEYVWHLNWTKIDENWGKVPFIIKVFRCPLPRWFLSWKGGNLPQESSISLFFMKTEFVDWKQALRTRSHRNAMQITTEKRKGVFTWNRTSVARYETNVPTVSTILAWLYDELREQFLQKVWKVCIRHVIAHERFTDVLTLWWS